MLATAPPDAFHSVPPALLGLLVLTLGAALLVWIFQRLRLSPVLGYLLLGMAISPFQKEIFQGLDAAPAFAELGVILLMFFIGLEFHLDELRSMLVPCLVGGGLQVVLTAGVVTALIQPVLHNWPASVVVGLMVSFSSTALVMKGFADRQEEDSPRARLSLAVLLFQDLAAILAVALLPLAATFLNEGVSLGWDNIKRFLVLFLGLPALFFGARYLLPRLFRQMAEAHVQEAFSLLSIGAVLLVAVATQFAGGSLALGAFLGGLVISRTPFATQIVADLTTLRNLALAFFFVSVGLLIDLRFLWNNIEMIATAWIILVLLKLLLATIALRIARVPLALAAGVGLALAQIGEFSFVLVQQAKAHNLVGEHRFPTMLTLAVLSLMLTPFLVNASASFSRWLSRGVSEKPDGAAKHKTAADVRAIVVGYGPVGKTLTRLLRVFGIEPVVIDLNLATIERLKAIRIAAVYGDASRTEVLEAAGIRSASYLLVTQPDQQGRLGVIAAARRINPKLTVLVRSRYLSEEEKLKAAGATEVHSEETTVAVALAQRLLHEIGVPQDVVAKEAARIPDEIGMRSGFTMMVPRSETRRQSESPGPDEAPKSEAAGSPPERPNTE